MEISGINLDTLEVDTVGSWPIAVRRLLMGAAAILTLMAGYYFYLSDEWAIYNTVSSEKEKAMQQFEDTQNQVANLEAYKQQVKVVQEQLSLLTEQLPFENDEAGLLEDISRQASTSGLQIRSIKPGKTVEKGFYVEHPIDLELMGNYSGFGQFVSNISSMSRIVTLQNFSIKREKAENGSLGSLVMSVTANTYTLKEKQSAIK